MIKNASQFKLVEHLKREDLQLHPLWTTVDCPDDQAAIIAYGISEQELAQWLNEFEGWAEGYTHPWYPILDLSRDTSPELLSVNFWLNRGTKHPGYFIDSHCFCIFVGSDDYIFNRNLPDLAEEEASRLTSDAKIPSKLFPIRYEAAMEPVTPLSRSGLIEAFW